jgi:signal transduction histidine kinase/uncharacterized protein YdeI (YjbR/CyaY-like superfamily)
VKRAKSGSSERVETPTSLEASRLTVPVKTDRTDIELRLAREQAAEALEQQRATAEILRVISSSPANVEPVFRTILSSGSRLCNSSIGAMFMFDGEVLMNVAHLNASDDFVKFLNRTDRRPSRETTTRRCALERRTVHTADLMNDPDYAPPAFQRRENVRAALSVPMISNGVLVGVITLWRREPVPFTERQIALVQTFADQAVIAIENVRLFNETREALEQQTATAEILRVISKSPTDVQPVFDAIVQSGIRLFEGAGVTLSRPENGQVCLMAIAERDSMRVQLWKERFPFPLTREYMHGTAILDCRMVDMPDVEQMDEQYAAGKRNFAASGYRAMTVVPMVKDGTAIGTIAVIRDAPGPLGDKKIALLKTFADQAVIAIENVRLFNETHEALEQQKASAEVLRAISSSIADTAPVFDKILESCGRLFAGQIVGLNLVGEDGMLHSGAFHGCHREEFLRRFPTSFSEGSSTWLAIKERRVVHFPDVEHDADVPLRAREGCRTLGIKSVLFAPMLWEGRGLGAIFVGRDHIGSFSDKEIALLKTFADQAAIAIENVRLFNETHEALEQQKASAEVLGAISSSIADTAPVFDKILESCERLFAGRIVGLNLVQEDGFLHIGAYHGAHREEFESIFPLPVTQESGSGLAIVEQRVIHYPDTEHGVDVPAKTRRGCQIIGIKSAIFAPVLWEGRGMGAIFVGRDHVSSFSEREIALLRTFADQAAIAIENVRLFNEIQEKSRQLEVANRHKSEFLANMSHELRTPLNAIIGFTRIVMRRAGNQIETRQYENLEKILLSGQHLLALINSILDLAKVEAGKVEVNPVEIEPLRVLESCVRTIEPLIKGDAVRLIKECDDALPRMYVDEEKMRQIVINLLSNAAKFTDRGSVRLRARVSGDAVVIAVADTGIGIAPDQLDAIFEEFAQAGAASTQGYGGTGLGLTIARRLARLMGGEIVAESVLDSGSIFTLTLPLRYDASGIRLA